MSTRPHVQSPSVRARPRMLAERKLPNISGNRLRTAIFIQPDLFQALFIQHDSAAFRVQLKQHGFERGAISVPVGVSNTNTSTPPGVSTSRSVPTRLPWVS